MTQHQIVQVIRELVLTTGYDCDDIELRFDPLTQTVIINIVGKGVSPLIGYKGEGIHALRHLVQRVLDQRSKNEETATYTPFTLDIENYYTNELEQLKRNVLACVETVRASKKAHALEPMTSYERLIVHALLSPYTDIGTSSHGEGNERHIIIDIKEVADK